jgi:CubicO group peptidase (beta-lactamase class C family)
MPGLRQLLERYVDEGSVPGAVALFSTGGRVESEAVGFADAAGAVPLAGDAIFRVASITKPITAAAAMLLLDEGRLRLDDPIGEWLPELASPSVVRRPDSPVEDVVPAERPITVLDLLTFRAGYGFPSDFSLPAVQPLLAAVQEQMRSPHSVPSPDEWLAGLAEIPMLHQPGEAWLYNTCADILGVLIGRVSGESFSEFLAERVFEPLAMNDTGFSVPEEKLERLVGYYAADPSGALSPIEPPDRGWEIEPAFASGAGGLASTAEDWHAFGRLLLDGGAVDGRRILSETSVRAMTTNRLTDEQRAASTLFLEGQGWGFGGSVDVEPIDPWNVPGRYGWVGGTGTAAHVVPATGTIALLLTQVQMAGPTPTPLMRDFWRYAAGVGSAAQ